MPCRFPRKKVWEKQKEYGFIVMFPCHDSPKFTLRQSNMSMGNPHQHAGFDGNSISGGFSIAQSLIPKVSKHHFCFLWLKRCLLAEIRARRDRTNPLDQFHSWTAAMDDSEVTTKWDLTYDIYICTNCNLFPLIDNIPLREPRKTTVDKIRNPGSKGVFQY